jgi:hypothetical protein
LPTFTYVETPASGVPPLNLTLGKGIWLEGTIRDEELMQPVWGNVYYYAFRDNPSLPGTTGFNIDFSTMRCPFLTDLDGRYRIPVLPGRGLIAFNSIAGPEGRRYPTFKGQNRIEGQIGEGYWAQYPTVPIPCQARSFQAVREVRASENEPLLVDVSLRAAKRVTLRVLDPNGKEVTSGLWYSGAWEANLFGMTNFKPTGFHVGDYDESFTRRLLFCHKERNLAGVLLLSGPQRSPVEVKLTVAGALVGRVVTATGKPLPGLFLKVKPLVEGESPAEIGALPEFDYRTEDTGRFEIKGLAANVKYSIAANVPSSGPMLIVADATVQSGKTSDVGAVTPVPIPGPRR